MDELTFMILKVVVAVAAALITGYLIPYIKAKTAEVTQKRIADMVKDAVEAAEQTISGGGALKKTEVLRYASEWLEVHGVKITDEQLNTLIEAAVFRKNKGE